MIEPVGANTAGDTATIFDSIPAYGPIAPDDAGTNALSGIAGFTGSASDTKKVLISIGVLILFVIIMVEVAGISKQWAVAVGLLLLSVVMINLAHTNTSSWAQYPWIP